MTMNCNWIILLLILITGHLWGVYNFELMELMEVGIWIRVSVFNVSALQCLKKGILCPKYLTHLNMEGHTRGSGDDNPARVRPSIYPDLIQMTTMPPRAPQIAILPGEHVQGACWTAPMEN